MSEYPTFFATPEAFREWLRLNHKAEAVLWVGYYKKATGIPSITWQDSVDQALCFGWIDGLRKRVDESRYKIRFTPRKPNSIWSAVNIKRMEELNTLGLVEAAGHAAYARRKDAKSEIYAYEQQKAISLTSEYESYVRQNPAAWEYFSKLPPGYKRQTIWWVMSAKKEETRLRRLSVLIESSAAGLKIPHLRREGK